MDPAHLEFDSSISVLLINDDPAQVAVLGEALSGCSMVIVPQMIQALEHLSRAQPDAILIRIELEENEASAVRLLRSQAPAAAIVAIIPQVDDHAAMQVIRDGAQEVLVSDPLTPDAARRSLRYALERQHLTATLKDNVGYVQTLFAQPVFGIAYVNPDGRFRLANTAFREIFGVTLPELRERSFIEIIFPDEAASELTNLNQLFDDDQEHREFERPYTLADGTIIWAGTVIIKARPTTSKPAFFLAIVQDITERKRAAEAQLYLASIVENSDDAIYGKSLDGIIVSWNAAAERIYGWPADEILGQTAAILIPPDLEEEYHQVLVKIRRGESIPRTETRRIRKDGQQRDIALTISPIKDAAGQLVGASSIARDITTFKWAQLARQESEQRLQQLTDNINEVLWLRDAQTRQMLYVSAAFSTVWGVPRERLYQDPYSFTEYIHPDDQNRVLDALRQDEEGEFDEEYRIIRPDGEVRWIHARHFPIRDDTGMVYRIAGLSEDITTHKHLVLAEQEQRALAEALRNVANALNTTVDMAEIMDRLLTNIEHVVPHDAAEIMLIEGPRAKIVRSRGYANRGLQEALDAMDFVLAETPNLYYMVQHQKPLIVPDVEQVTQDRAIKQSPARFWRSYAGVPITTKNDEVIGFINVGSVIPYFFTPIHADRLQAFAEQAAIAIQNARLYAETRHLAAYSERQRLARDLHDAVSQTLFAATITTETLMRQAERDPASVFPKLAELHQLTRGALAETRAVLLELRPESLMEVGFGTLIQQLIEAVLSRKRLRIVHHIEPVDNLAPTVKLMLYRITQEALNNVIKHAQASQVTITFSAHDADLTLEISDDGRGFDISHRQPTSMGLTIMRERAESVGAILEIRSILNQGTYITVRYSHPEGQVSP